LTAKQDAILVGVTQAFSANNLPLSVLQIRSKIQDRFSEDTFSD